MTNAVAAFYDRLGGSKARTGKRRRGQPAPPPPPPDHTRRPAAQREQMWRHTGNEPHNLPPLFAAFPDPLTSPRCTPRPPRTSPHRARPQWGSRSGARLTLCWPQVVGPEAQDPEVAWVLLAWVFQFLPTVSLGRVAQCCWGCALVARPLVRARVERRVQRVQELEERAQAESWSVGEAMREAEGAVRAVSRADLEEVRKTRKPSELVQTLAEAIVLCFNPAMKRRPTWKDFQKISSDPTELHQRMVHYDRALLTTRLLDRLRVMIDNEDFQEERTARVSSAVNGLSSWLRGIYVYGRCLYVPWKLDRERQQRECDAYLATEQLPPPEGKSVPDAGALERVLQRAAPLVTVDDFGADAGMFWVPPGSS
eukprot:TRINITY_DN9317_c0_g1_i1.p1 TRINITY_DN9317_c0_g1~~TRINITY_DN9317_c0_g1_i1.p1  ORF type:complete len:393 (+),score=77.61 TRINITY_DN9317_c0_g1_i1:76-1179(+)